MNVKFRNLCAVILLTTILTSAQLTFLEAFEVRIQLKDKGVEVILAVAFYQNFTSLTPRLLRSSSVEEGYVEDLLEACLKTRDPDIYIDEVHLEANVEENVISLETRFKVYNMAEESGRLGKLDLSWKAFNISTPVKIAGVEVNRVGEEYIKPVLEKYSNPAYARIWNGSTQVEPEKTLNIIGNLTVLDLQSLEPPLSGWRRTFLVENMTTMWTIQPEPRLNMTLTYTSENVTKSFYGRLSYTATVTVPYLAHAEGNLVYFQLGEGKEELYMAATVIGLLACTIAFTALGARKRVEKRR
ncbi:MAG: hypothetical protein QXO32_00225 [Candidatus Bathyarchaeia archaeon]